MAIRQNERNSREKVTWRFRLWGGFIWMILLLISGGTAVAVTVPQQVAGFSATSASRVTAVATGANHSLALLEDGTVTAWGLNFEGELGDGTDTDRTYPVTVGSLSGVTAITSGAYHSVALKNDGKIWAWGFNYWGQRGNGTTTDRHEPIQVTGLDGAGDLFGRGETTDMANWVTGHP